MVGILNNFQNFQKLSSGSWSLSMSKWGLIRPELICVSVTRSEELEVFLLPLDRILAFCSPVLIYMYTPWVERHSEGKMSHPRTQCNVLISAQTQTFYPGMSAPIRRPLHLFRKVFCNVQVSTRMVLTYLQDLKQGKRTEQLLRKQEHPEQTLVCHHLELVRHLLDGANQ